MACSMAIIADGYFVSNRNKKQLKHLVKRIIADGYFVSNRNGGQTL